MTDTVTTDQMNRLARIQAGIDPLPATERYMVLDPLHLVPLRAKVAKLSRKACTRGGLPVTLWEGDAQWVARARPDGSMATIRVREVAVIGDVPDTGDWEYAAALHHAPSGTILQRAKAAKYLGDEELARYRARGPVCDHCEMRRGRHDTYVVRNRVTGEVSQVGRTCLAAYCAGSPDAAVYAFDLQRMLTEEIRAHAKLDDAVRAEDGIPVRDALVNAFGGDTGAADACLDAATRDLIPSLVEERRIALEGGEWNQTIARLPEALHNATVIVAEGFVGYREQSNLRALVTWFRDSANRMAREALRSDPAAQMASLGISALPADPLELARMLVDPKMQAAATAFLALMAGGGTNGTTLGSQNPDRGGSLTFPDGSAGRVFWRGNNRRTGETLGVCLHGCRRCNDPRWVPVSEVRGW